MSLQPSMEKFFSNLGQFVSDTDKLCPKVVKLCQRLHKNIREQERQYGLNKPKSALHQLYLDGMDHDQIFEQLAANDEDLLNLDHPENLCMQVSDLKVAAEADLSRYQLLADAPITTEQTEDTDEQTDNSDDSDDSALSEDEGMEQDSDEVEEEDGEDQRDSSSLDEGVADGDSTLEDEEEDEEYDEEDGADDGNNTISEVASDDESEANEDDKDEKSDDSDSSGYDELDAQLYKKYVEKKDSEEEESDGELAVGSEAESDEEGNAAHQGLQDDDNEDKGAQSDDEQETKKSKKDSKTNPKLYPFSSLEVPDFSKTSVDSGFFNVRESEWIADEDILGANNFDDIDFMEDIEDSSDDEKATYKDFFDDGPLTMGKKKSKKRKSEKRESSGETGEEKWGVEEEEEEEDDVDDDEQQQEEEEQKKDTSSKTAPNTAQESQSRLEAELSAEARLREQLEESNIAAKPWDLQGEVRAKDRPTNSVLTQYLEYRSGARYRPEINEELTRRLEKIAVDRFRTKAFDSVERKAKIVDNPFEFKKKIVLDQEKSSKSLSKIYEEEYLRKEQTDAARESGEEEAQFKKLRAEFSEIQEMLRALSNAHYTPKMSQAEVKIVSNQPALRKEEATPLVVGDGDLLAPQEVLAPVRGELKGDTEKTTTDRKRERRSKKHLQHLKYKRQEEKTTEKVKKAAKLGKTLDVDTSANVVKKAIKIGSVKVMDNKGADVKGFFKQMNELSSKTPNKSAAMKRKRDTKN